MLKRIAVSIASILLVAVLFLFCLWYFAANNAKEQVKAQLARLNTENSNVSYEDISASGFPFYLKISVQNPHFTGRIDKLLDETAVEAIFKTKQLPEWNEDYTLNGSISFSVSVFSNVYKMDVSGSWIGKAVVAGKAVNTASKASTANGCELKLNRMPADMLGKMWNFSRIDGEENEFLKDFREVSCNFAPGEYINSDNGEVIMASGGANVRLVRNPHEKTSEISFYLKSTDSEITKVGDDVFAIYQSIMPETKFSGMSANGKVNIEVDIAYNGTEDWKSEDVKTLPVEFKINKLSVSSDSYKSDTALTLSNSLEGGLRNFSLVYKNEAIISDVFRKQLANSLVDMVKEMANKKTPEGLADSANNGEQVAAKIQGSSFSSLKEKLEGFKPDELEAMVISVVPDFASFGKITSNIEAKYSGDDNFTDGLASLNGFEIATQQYGVSASGELKRSKEVLVPTGKLNVRCNDCLKIIDDANAYLQRVRSVVATLEPQDEGKFTISAEMISGAKSFLKAVGTPDEQNKQILYFNIESSGKSEPTVNGKPISEVLAIYNQNINMNQSEPVRN